MFRIPFFAAKSNSGVAKTSQKMSRYRPVARRLRHELLEDRRLLSWNGVVDTEAFPNSAAVKIQAFWETDTGDKLRLGSGALISDYHVLTAAHAIYNNGTNPEMAHLPLGYADKVIVSPGQNGEYQRPYGEFRATRKVVTTLWAAAGDNSRNYDLGILTLDGNIGDFTGYFGYGSLAESTLGGMTVEILHYPADDDPPNPVPGDGYDQIYSTIAVKDPSLFDNAYQFEYTAYSDNLFRDDAGTEGGSSGAPVFVNETINGEQWSNIIVGVHARRKDGYSVITPVGPVLVDDVLGQAQRITPGLFDWIGNEIQEDPRPIDRADLVDYDDWFGTSSSFITSGSLQQWGDVTISARIQNNGTAAATDFNVSFYATRDERIGDGSDDYLIGRTHVSSLAPFEFTDVAWSGLVDLPTGDFYVRWWIDEEGRVSEYDDPDFSEGWYNDGWLDWEDVHNPENTIGGLHESNPGMFDRQRIDVRATPPDVAGDRLQDAQSTLPLFATVPVQWADHERIGNSPLGRKDVDLYEFTAFRGSTLAAETSLHSGDVAMDTYLRVFDHTGRELASDDNSGADAFSRVELVIPHTGTFYVGVSGDGNRSYNPLTAGSGSNGERGVYAVSLELTPGTDVGGTIATALDMGFGVDGGTFGTTDSIGDGIDRLRDVDLFRFDAIEHSKVTAITAQAAVGRTMDTFLRLFDESGNQLARDDDGYVGLFSRVNYEIPATGTYYLGVSSDANCYYNPAIAGTGSYGSSFGDYELNVNLTPPWGRWSRVTVRPEDTDSELFFGYNVAVDGNTAVVSGSPYGQSRGRIFERVGTEWLETKVLPHNGLSVAVSGDTVAVGGTYGPVYVLRNIGGNWVEEASFTQSGNNQSQVALLGNTLVVGMPRPSESISEIGGTVYVYERHDANTPENPSDDQWSLVKTITAPPPFQESVSMFGYSVALSEDALLIGTYSYLIQHVQFFEQEWWISGRSVAFMYDRSWDLVSATQLRPWNDFHAWPVYGDVDGDTAVICDSEFVYVYQLTGSLDWIQTQKLEISDTGGWRTYEASVSISGDTIVVGARKALAGGGVGAAYVFRRTSEGWIEQSRLTADADPYYGTSVAVSGETIVVGAPRRDDGTVHIFESEVGLVTIPPGQETVDVFREGDELVVRSDDGELYRMRLDASSGLLIHGSPDSETFTVTVDDLTSIGLPWGIRIRGGEGSGDNDTLVVTGTQTVDNYKYTTGGPEAGTIEMDNLVLYFDEFEPIIDTLPVRNRVFAIGTDGDQTIRVADDGDPENGMSIIDTGGTGGFESIVFLAPVESFEINAGKGDNVVILEELEPTFEADVVVNLEEGNDSVDASAFLVPVTLRGGPGADNLRGGKAGDILDGGEGIDDIDGGPGDDSVVADTVEDVVMYSGDTLELLLHFAAPKVANIDWGDESSDAGTADNVLGIVSGSHLYTADGEYTVEVTVTDAGGNTAMVTINVVVRNMPPAVTITDVPSHIEEGSTFEALGQFVDYGTDTWTATVNYGDDPGDQPIGLNADKTFSLSHKYADDGEYEVTVAVRDGHGNVGEASVMAIIVNAPPSITVDHDPTSGNEGQLVVNTGTFSDPGDDEVSLEVSLGSIVADDDGTWSWSFPAGDGPAVAQSVAITATDSDGAEFTTSFVFAVNNVAPTATFSNNGPVDEGNSVNVSFREASDPSSADINAGLHYSYALDAAGLAADYATAGNEASAEFTFDDNGQYTVWARIYDKDDWYTQYGTIVTINNVAPSFGAGEDETLLPPSLGVFSRNDIRFTDPGADVWSGTVDFGDETVRDLVIDQEGKTFDLNHTYMASGTYTVTVRVEDDDGGISSGTFQVEVILAEVEFAQAEFVDLEDVGTSLVVQLQRTPLGTNVTSVVEVTISGGTAAPGIDYDDTGFPLLVTFDPGVDAVSVPVPIDGDNTVELDETVTFSVSSKSNALILDQKTATLTIQNDDTAEFSVDNVSGNEDDGPLTFTVMLSNPVDVATSVAVSTSDGTALVGDSDYTAVEGLTLPFDAGETSRTFVVAPLSDQKVELNETFGVSLGNVVNGGRSVTASSEAGIGTILNDDTATVTINDVVVTEGDSSDTTLFIFAVTSSADVDVAFSIGFATQDDMAIAGSDYNALTGTVSFGGAAGETQTIQVEVLGDDLAEFDDIFFVNLTDVLANGRDVRIDDGQGLGTIVNDDYGVNLLEDGTLLILGTHGKDHVDVKLLKSATSQRRGGGVDEPTIRVKAKLNGRGGSADFTMPAVDVENIVIYVCGGDDHVHVHKDVTMPAMVDGGTGKDHLKAGGGNTVLLGGSGDDHLDGGKGDDLLDGGAGDDHLHGNKGNDILLGRAGYDKLYGDAGLDMLVGGPDKDDLKGGRDDDILIGGRVTLELEMLEDVRDVWMSGSSYEDRVTELTGSLLAPEVTVLDDGVKDTLKGDKGRDLFFAMLGGADKDEVKDKKSNEDLFDLTTPGS